MNYSKDPSRVRVDFFKPSGKWYETEELVWDRYKTKDDNGNIELIHETFKRCLNEQVGKRLAGMQAICLEPYHEYSHPISVIHLPFVKS